MSYTIATMDEYGQCGRKKLNRFAVRFFLYICSLKSLKRDYYEDSKPHL